MSRKSGPERDRPVLLLAAHGTQVEDGLRTVDRVTRSVRRARPELRVVQAFLDVLQPSLATALTPELGPTVVVPGLLSTGYHVSQDIPAVVGARPDTAVSRHLGPHPLLTAALLDRLAAARGGRPARGPVALVATGSSNPAAAEDLQGAADALAAALGQDVRPLTLADHDFDAQLAGCREVASYLLAEGFFEQTLRVRAARAGIDTVSDVLGPHPAVIELILARYDAAAETLGSQPVDSAAHPAR